MTLATRTVHAAGGGCRIELLPDAKPRPSDPDAADARGRHGYRTGRSGVGRRGNDIWKPPMSKAPDPSANIVYAPPEIARARTLPEIFNARAAVRRRAGRQRARDRRRGAAIR